ncbi:MAG: DNA pilot protein [Microvirus sp.]|nr:MAG: DNA pilot protein [Microvirus sp.]
MKLLNIQYDILGDITGGGTSAATTAAASGNTAGMISAGSGLVGGLISSITQGAVNRKARQFATDTYNKQRKDAIADRDYANQYNSPQAAMARYKAAGLNPNLIYGMKPEPSQAVRSSSLGSYAPPPSPDYGKPISTAFGNYQNARQQSVQTDLTGQMLENSKVDELQKRADVWAQIMKNDNYEQYGTPLIAAETDKEIAEARKRSADADLAEVNSAIAYTLKASNITQGLEAGVQALIKSESDRRVRDNLKIIGDNLGKDTELKQLDIDSQSWNFNANSPIWQQVIGKLLTAILSHASK